MSQTVLNQFYDLKKAIIINIKYSMKQRHCFITQVLAIFHRIIGALKNSELELELELLLRGAPLPHLFFTAPHLWLAFLCKISNAGKICKKKGF